MFTGSDLGTVLPDNSVSGRNQNNNRSKLGTIFIMSTKVGEAGERASNSYRNAFFWPFASECWKHRSRNWAKHGSITAAGLSAGVQMEVRLTLCHGENNLEGEATDVLGTVEETYEECLSAGSSLRESCESKIWVESSGTGHVETVEKTESKHGRFPKGKISINKDMQWWWSTGLSGERWVNED